jgi:nitroimidazol reductase NimA-like FMN-containing flavoprotein (pyridoxamine 5'-phosphate oxidase superfamily)
VDALRASDKVCFTVYGSETVKEESWAPYVQSAVVFGRCHIMKDNDMAMEMLKQLAMKYYPNEEMVFDEIEKAGKAAYMFEIEIEHLSGKVVQEK